MNNRIIDIRSHGKDDFELAFKLLFGECKIATHYFKDPDYGLIFFWHKDKFKNQENTELPCKMDAKQAANMAWTWLIQQEEDSYKEFLDLDGCLGRGFRVFNETWTHVGESPYAICAIQPIWAWYGK